MFWYDFRNPFLDFPPSFFLGFPPSFGGAFPPSFFFVFPPSFFWERLFPLPRCSHKHGLQEKIEERQNKQRGTKPELLDRSHGGSNIFFLLIFRPRGLLGPRGAVLCGTLRTQKVVPHLGGGEKHQKLHEMDREASKINIT